MICCGCTLRYKTNLSQYNMDQISDVSVVECNNSKYLKPFRLKYTQNGVPKVWDLMEVKDSVVILVYNSLRKVLVFVKQFRPAIYWSKSEKVTENESTTINTEKNPGAIGLTYELCAGLVDKDCSLVEIAQQELLEELGYKVPLYKIQKVTSYRTGVGVSGGLQTLFYAEVSDVMRETPGGGLEEEGEIIDTVEIPVEQGRGFIYDETVEKPVPMMFALQWFFEKKYKPAS